MEDKQYRRKLWTYSVLVVIASVCSSGTLLLAFIDLPSAVNIALGIGAVVLFVYATIWFGNYLRLTGKQWLAALLLLLLAWTGSALYMATRTPNARAGG